MADLDRLAQALFGNPRAESQEVLTDATTRTYIGYAETDSEDGTAYVTIEGDVTLPDDIEDPDGNVVVEYSGTGIEMAVGPSVSEGDEVVVTLVGGGPLKTPMVTSVAGEGDAQNEEIDLAQSAAQTAWEWANDAYEAAEAAQDSADAAQQSADDAAQAASDAQDSADAASDAAATAVADAATAKSQAAAAVADAATAKAAATQAASDASAAAASASAAEASASSAESSASSASTSASNAATSASNAESSASSAATSASNAATDAATASEQASAATTAANEAKTQAQTATTYANEAKTQAAAAVTSANEAKTSAAEAKTQAATATTYANSALVQLGTVEDVLGTVNWITEHGTWALTTDTEVDADKVYYTRTGSGTEADPYLYTEVAEPTDDDIATYYELSIDAALSQYVAAHLALTNAGLWVLLDDSGYKVLLSNTGMTVYDATGTAVATYGESITFDTSRPFTIGDNDAYIIFDGDGHITIGGSGVTISALSDYSTTSEMESAIGDAVDAIEVGGRNLLLGTADWSSWKSSSGATISGDELTYSTNTVANRLAAVAVEPGETYTISFDAYAESEYTYGTSGNTMVLMDYSSSESYSRVSTAWVCHGLTLTTDWQRFSDTFTVPSTATIGWVFVSLRNVSSDPPTYHMRHMKLERGTIATDWTPAPEDMATDADLTALTGRVSTAETAIETNAEAITLKANSTDVYTKTAVDGLITTEVAERNAAITTASDSITSSVAETYATKTTVATVANPNLSPYYAGDLADVYNASTNPDGYWKINPVRSSELGVVLTQGDDGWAHLSMDNSEGSTNAYLNCYAFDPCVESASTDHTLLIEIGGYEGTGAFVTYQQADSDTYVQQLDCEGGNTSLAADGTYRIVRTSKSNLDGCNMAIRFTMRLAAGAEVDCDIRISLYEGDYSGPYKPYVDQTLTSRVTTAESSITQTKNSITSLVANTETYTDPDGNTVTNTINSAIQQNAEDITLKVDADGVIAAINVSTEGVTIDADKVNISGATLFTSGRLSESTMASTYDAYGAASTAKTEAISSANSYTDGEIVTLESSAVASVATKDQYYLSTSSSSATGGSWSDTVPTWSTGTYVWTRVATTKTTVSGTSSTTYSDAVYDSALTTALGTAASAQDAADGAAASVVTTKQYYLSTSSASATGGSWSESVPTWESGTYIWTRYAIVRTTVGGTTSTTYTPSSAGAYDSQLTTALATATAAQEDIDNLSIGGRNLLYGTADFDRWGTNGATVSDGVATFPARTSLGWPYVRRVHIPVDDLGEGTYTLGFDYRSDDFSDTSGSPWVYVNVYGSATVGGSRTKYRLISATTDTRFVPTTEWQRGTITFDWTGVDFLTSGSGDVAYVGVEFYNRTLNHMQIRKVKLEKGNRATDWTPAPEDVDADIATAQSTAEGANQQEQLVYKSAVTGTTSMSAPTAWVSDATGAQATWTTVRPEYSRSYPVLFVATQRQTVGGTLSCTTPAIDATTTVIDGGNIITRSITASQIATNSLTANEIDATDLHVSAANIDGTISFGSLPDTVAQTTDIPTTVAELNDSGNYLTTTTASNTYATQTALTNGLATKQDAGDYATNTALTTEANQRKATYGTCSTAAGTAAKTVTCANFALVAGSEVAVKFTYANTANVPTLNVNSTGATAIWVAGEVTSATNMLKWAAGATVTFRYDGSVWQVVGEPRTWYGTCSTAAGTAAKTDTVDSAATVAGFVLCKGAKVELAMTYANTASSPTLNVAGTGARALYYGTGTTRPTVSGGTSWLAESTHTFTFDGAYWRCSGKTYLSANSIVTGDIDADRIKANVISAINSLSAGTIDADRIDVETITIGQSQVTDLASDLSDLSDDIDAANVGEHVLYYASASTTAPSAPTAQVTTSSASTYGAWNLTLPTYSSSYPYLYTCMQRQTGGGTYSWTAVQQSSYAAWTDAINTSATNAAKTATNFITAISGNGIWVTPSDAKPDSNGDPVPSTGTNPTSGWHISDALELFRLGVSMFKVWVASGVTYVRVGAESLAHILMSGESFNMMLGSVSWLEAANESLRIGANGFQNIVVGLDGITFNESNGWASRIDYSTEIHSKTGDVIGGSMSFKVNDTTDDGGECGIEVKSTPNTSTSTGAGNYKSYLTIGAQNVKLASTLTDTMTTVAMDDFIRAYGVELFSDTYSSTYNQSISLSQSATLFSRMLIEYEDSTGRCGSVWVDDPDGQTFGCQTMGSNSGTGLVIRNKSYLIDGSTIDTAKDANSRYMYGKVVIDTSNGVTWSSTQEIGITKVVGFY